jgi:hypothetical protein
VFATERNDGAITVDKVPGCKSTIRFDRKIANRLIESIKSLVQAAKAKA